MDKSAFSRIVIQGHTAGRIASALPHLSLIHILNGFLTVQLEHSLVEDIPAAAVQVQGRGLAQGVALGIGDHGGHRAVLAPPFMVGARQDVAACRQGQGVGQGLARFIFAAVDAGRGLVSGGAVALGTCLLYTSRCV